LRALRLALVSSAILLAGLVLSGARALAAGDEPVIAGESVSGVGEHGATLEATIDPDGLETTYAFWLGREVCTSPVASAGQCYILVTGPFGEGHIAAGPVSEAVSTTVTGLEVDTPYVYTVAAVSAAGHALGMEKQFRTLVAGGVTTEESPLPPIVNTPTPFERPAEAWIGKSAEEGAATALAEMKRKEEEREAANKLPAPIPIPKGEWCGEAGIACEGGEVIKPTPKTAAQLRAEKLATALRACRKDHSRTRRVECEKRARRRARGKARDR
jgi:hypothetical protein